MAVGGRRAILRGAQEAQSEKGTDCVADLHLPDSATDHEPHDRQPHADLSWFLRRELLTIPLLIVITGTLLVVGISPATFLFVVLLAIFALGFIWSPGK